VVRLIEFELGRSLFVLLRVIHANASFPLARFNFGVQRHVSIEVTDGFLKGCLLKMDAATEVEGYGDRIVKFLDLAK